MGRIRVGTSSWTDKTLLESGWYPAGASNPEERLKFYASRFDVVEVDSTYYGLPNQRNSVLWVERTPRDFRFEIKAFSLMTGHPTRLRSLPKDIREGLGDEAPSNVYPKHLDPETLAAIWEMFREALMPLHSAGKLGVVMFQFPQWFLPGKRSREEILRARERLPDYDIGVELRQKRWFADEEATRRTLDFFRSEGIPLVCVDMPQGFDSSIPPFAEATSDQIALVRFHGRNRENWLKKGITAAERFKYDYSDRELVEWTPEVRKVSEQAEETHSLFNNCYRDMGVRNARTFADLLPGLDE